MTDNVTRQEIVVEWSCHGQVNSLILDYTNCLQIRHHVVLTDDERKAFQMLNDRITAPSWHN